MFGAETKMSGSLTGRTTDSWRRGGISEIALCSSVCTALCVKR